MTTPEPEQSRSTRAELHEAILVLTSELGRWLQDRPQLKQAAKVLLAEILDSSSNAVALTGEASQPTKSASTRTQQPHGVTQSHHPVDELETPDELESLADGAASAIDVVKHASQTIETLSEQVDAEIAAESTPANESKLGIESNKPDVATNHSNISTADDTIFEPAASTGEQFDQTSAKPRYSEVSDADIPTMIERCRLKAEGARWAVERDERIRNGADFKIEVKPYDLDIIERAKQVPNCFLWMNQPRSDIRTQADDFELIADCFDALAETLTTLQTTLATDNNEQLMQIVQLLAEAQSSLRVAVSSVEDHPDTDQQLAYHWLRNRASRDRFYISRYMKITDPADPANCLEVQQQAIGLRDQSDLKRTQPKSGGQLDKARFHLRKIAADKEYSSQYDWEKVADAISDWIDEGGSTDSRELRTMLLPVLDFVPDVEFRSSFENLIDAMVATSTPLVDQAEPTVHDVDTNHAAIENLDPAQVEGADVPDQTHEVCESDRSLEIKQASQWLGGKRMLLFAGEHDYELQSRICQALQLQCEWIAPDEHHAAIEDKLADVDLCAVLVTNQWETLLWDEVCENAEKMQIPCVRLPATCTPQQIAVQVIKQCPNHLSNGDDFQSCVA